MAMVTVFDEIIAGVVEDVAAREAQVSFQDIKAQSRLCAPPRDACGALLASGCGIIAEVKGQHLAKVCLRRFLRR